MSKPDCEHYFLTAGGTREKCMIGRTPEFDCVGCPAFRPIREEHERWTDEERAHYLELAERAR